MRVVGGCDGGGTKCAVRIAVLAEDGSIAQEGNATAGPANVRSNPILAEQSIRTATSKALLAAGLPANCEIDTYVAALAGAGTSEIQAAWQLKLAELLSVRHVRVIADVVALFAAADVPEDELVIATVVGTGSIAWARYSDAEMSRAGGLGPDVGDEGGGYWLGKEAIQRSDHKNGAGPLRDRIRARVGLPIETANRRIATASLAQDVFEVSSDDPIAREIIADAAEHIARLLLQVAPARGASKDKPLWWICAGGVAVHQVSWLETIRQRVERSGIFLREPCLVADPVRGALRLALDSVL